MSKVLITHDRRKKGILWGFMDQWFLVIKTQKIWAVVDSKTKNKLNIYFVFCCVKLLLD